MERIIGNKRLRSSIKIYMKELKRSFWDLFHLLNLLKYILKIWMFSWYKLIMTSFKIFEVNILWVSWKGMILILETVGIQREPLVSKIRTVPLLIWFSGICIVNSKRKNIFKIQVEETTIKGWLPFHFIYGLHTCMLTLYGISI